MKIMQINDEMLKKIEEAAKIIKAGGLVIYPTDTIYGLAADPYNHIAILKVFDAKSRQEGKPLSVAVSSFDQMDELVFTNTLTVKLTKAFLPGPLTIILKKKVRLPEKLTGGSDKLGVRIPNHPVALKLAELTGPITATSANIAGNSNPRTANEAKEQIGDKIDFVLDAGESPIGEPSTVIDLSEEKIVIIRQGAISEEQLRKAIGE